jgi:ankyrin repeat protein
VTEEHAEQMIEACSFGKVEEVRAFLDSGVDVKSRNRGGDTALHYAVLSGCLPLCELLIERGHPLDVLDGDQRSPLQLAAECERLDVIELLVTRGATVDLVGELGRTPLHAAARSGKAAAVRLLVKLGAKIDGGKPAPLLVAAHAGELEVFTTLLDLGASLSVADEDGSNTLHFVADRTPSQQVTDLSRSGYKYQGQDLELWIRKGKIGVTVGGRDMKIAKRDFESMLGTGCPQYFRYQKLLKIAQLAIERGLDVHAKTSHGFTALHAFAQSGDLPVIKALVKAGAGVNDTTVTGATPLHCAAQSGGMDVAGFLLGKKADPSLRTATEWEGMPAGLTAADVARYQGNEELALRLQPRGGRRRRATQP